MTSYYRLNYFPMWPCTMRNRAMKRTLLVKLPENALFHPLFPMPPLKFDVHARFPIPPALTIFSLSPPFFLMQLKSDLVQLFSYMLSKSGKIKYLV